mgnify:CR=1 FL=1
MQVKNQTAEAAYKKAVAHARVLAFSKCALAWAAFDEAVALARAVYEKAKEDILRT